MKFIQTEGSSANIFDIEYVKSVCSKCRGCFTTFDFPTGQTVSADVSVEYAKSARSECRGCFTTIEKGVVRIGEFCCCCKTHDGTGNVPK